MQTDHECDSVIIDSQLLQVVACRLQQQPLIKNRPFQSIMAAQYVYIYAYIYIVGACRETPKLIYTQALPVTAFSPAAPAPALPFALPCLGESAAHSRYIPSHVPVHHCSLLLTTPAGATTDTSPISLPFSRFCPRHRPIYNINHE